MIAIWITAGILTIALGLYIYRQIRLSKIQKKRDNLDLTTKRGKAEKDRINQQINKLMFYADPEQ